MSDASWSLVVRRLAAALRQPIGLAVAVAAAITLVLFVAVLAAWTAGSESDGEPTALAALLLTPSPAGAAGHTPTPRIIATRPPQIPTASAPSTTTPPSGEAGPNIAAAPEPTSPAPAPVRTATPAPEPTATLRPTATPRPSPTPTPEALYAAENAADFAAWATGSWAIAGDELVNEGASVLPEPWTTGPYRPEDDAYAVEAEIRVRGLIPGYSCQSFGLVVGPPTAPRGAGVIFPCQGAPARSRLTDVTAWPNGYNAVPELAAEPFEPDEGWQTYRLEVRGADLRLLIDGDEVLAKADALAAPRGRSDPEIGLWSQGVRLAVRRLSVLPLPADPA